MWVDIGCMDFCAMLIGVTSYTATILRPDIFVLLAWELLSGYAALTRPTFR